MNFYFMILRKIGCVYGFLEFILLIAKMELDSLTENMMKLDEKKKEKKSKDQNKKKTNRGYDDG